MRDKVTRQCPHTTTFLKRKESRSGTEPRSFCLPLGQTCSQAVCFIDLCIIYKGAWYVPLSCKTPFTLSLPGGRLAPCAGTLLIARCALLSVATRSRYSYPIAARQMCMLVKLRGGGGGGGLSGGHEDEKSSCSRHKTQRFSSGAAEKAICCPKDI